MSNRSISAKEVAFMMVTVDVITQVEVMRTAAEFRANNQAMYGCTGSWEEAFAAVPCASCDQVEFLSKEGFCMGCDS